MKHEVTPVTSGNVIHHAHSYDLFGTILTLGRMQKMRERTAALARVAPGNTVLDVGCGTGELTMVLARKASAGGRGQVYGIDPSPEMIELARKKAAGAGLAIDYRLATVEALPFADATFDVVTSSLMLHHLPGDLKGQGLAEIRRVLKPGGCLVVVDLTQPLGRLGRIALTLIGHGRMANVRQDLAALLTAAGFTRVETGPVGGTLGFRLLGFARAQAPA